MRAHPAAPHPAYGPVVSRYLVVNRSNVNIYINKRPFLTFSLRGVHSVFLNVHIFSLKAHAKHATSPNIVACCWGFLAQQCCVRLHWPKRLTGFKLYATSANIVVPCKRTQHVGLYNVACCWPTMLPPFAWALNNLIVYKPQKNVIRPVSNRPELDENIPILLENPNRDSISVGTQEQLSQTNN